MMFVRVINSSSMGLTIEDLGVYLPGRGSSVMLVKEVADSSKDLSDLSHYVTLEDVLLPVPPRPPVIPSPIRLPPLKVKGEPPAPESAPVTPEGPPPVRSALVQLSSSSKKGRGKNR
jgi:hypothetical protein